MADSRFTSLRRRCAALVLVGALAALATPMAADEYDARRAGHPLRVLAYALHPVGVALDWLIFRPAHWAGSQPAMSYIFGHQVYEDRGH